MSIYYRPKKVMNQLDCKEKPDLAAKLLEHDPNMVSNMTNLTFDLVSPLIKLSITYLDKMGVFNFATDGDRDKALELAYSKNKTSKRAIIEFVSLASDDTYMEWSWTKNNSSRHKEIDISGLKNLFEKIIKDNPEYVIATPFKYMENICKKIGGINYKNLVKSLDMKKAYKKVNDAKNSSSVNGENILYRIQNKLYQSTWFGSDLRRIEPDELDVQINWLAKVRPDDKELDSVMLLIKLS
jgi:hypothetical protein